MNQKPSEKDSDEQSKSPNPSGNNSNLPNNPYTMNNFNPINVYALPPPGYMIPPGYNPYYPW